MCLSQLYKLVLFLELAGVAGAASVNADLFERLQPRNIGPAIMGGRIADIEGVPGNPSLVYVASASGGLWKTTNQGITWTAIFDDQPVISIGALALDPRNPDVIWVGTGEASARNSVSFGDGVYKSLDGGKTWRNLGLHDSHSISRIVVNPINPEIVYVAVLGHNSGPNEESGVFMTSDGGEHWKKVLYIDAEHGAADMDINPTNPNIVLATMWRFDRKPWRFISGGEKGGLFRSVDGGLTWKKVTDGIPKTFGRMGVKVAAGDPKVVYAIGESDEGTLFRSDDSGEHFKMISKDPALVGRGLYYSQMRVDPNDENRIYSIGMSVSTSIDGGKTIHRIANKTHSDYHTIWIDPKNSSHMWMGDDGGIATTWDKGENWEFVGNIALGQFYQVTADNRAPFYNVYGGLQDNGTYAGPSRKRQPEGILNDDWQMVSFGDGFHVVVNQDDPDLVLSENQGGGIVLTDLHTLEQHDVSPQPRRNDGGPVNELKYRFNWNTPIVASPNDKNTVYFGGNVIFKSTDFGKTWSPMSPDLTTNDPEKLKSVGTIWTENTTAEYHCTVIRIAESPVKAGMVWAGTDDGNLQMTSDGGKNWSNLTGNFKGVPKFSEIASIEPSRTAAGTAYVAFENHWFDDLHPYIFKTTDDGKSWTNITSNLPANAYVWVVKQDPKNPRLLYAGTELGLFVSFNEGGDWMRLKMKGFPPAEAVRDLMIHPKENDLIIGTHGRSVWILDDITPLQQASETLNGQASVLFAPRNTTRFDSRFTRYGIGNKPFAGPNPPYGAPITYYLESPKTVKIEILDKNKKVIRELTQVPKEKGLNRTTWDLRYQGPDPRRLKAEDVDPEEEFSGPRGGPQALPGDYVVRLTADGEVLEKPLTIYADPTVKATPAELQTAFDYGIKLRDLQTSTNLALRAVDSLRDQLQQVEKSMTALNSKPPADLMNSLSERLQQLHSMELQLARPRDIPGYSVGPRLIDRLGGLGSELDHVLAAPTQYQREYYNELQQEFISDVGRVNTFISKGVPEVNDALTRQNGPTLMGGKPVKLPDWLPRDGK